MTDEKINIVNAEMVREALEKLYENLALTRTVLATMIPEVINEDDLQMKAQLLRKHLLFSIELLQPSRPEPFGSRTARSYEVLSLRYVEGMNISAVAEEFGLAERQIYRDLRRAYEDLAVVINEHLPKQKSTQNEPTDKPAQSSSLQEELHHFDADLKQIDTQKVLELVLQIAQPLSIRFQIPLEMNLQPSLPPVLADSGVLNQVLTQILSLALQYGTRRGITLTAKHTTGLVHIGVNCYISQKNTSLFQNRLVALQQLAEAQNWLWFIKYLPDEKVELCLSLKSVEPRIILVVEDNESAVELYRRYLIQNEQWKIVEVKDPRLSYELAVRLRPAVILLDIMMPRQDGWSILQLMRSHEETARIPIIICSVFHDPELAEILGANAYLTKPVTRNQLITTLQAVVH